MEEDVRTRERYAELAQELARCLQAGESEQAERLLDELTDVRETELFRELGRLTRQLHESLNTFRLDSRLSELTQYDIPDARERLNYVIAMTEQAAHRTLTAIEDSMTLNEAVTSRAQELRDAWQRFRRREMEVAEFREFSRELDDFFEQLDADGAKVSGNLTEALMAQDYQDLTGQVLRRVISLVQELEENLVKLVRIAGAPETAENRQAADKGNKDVIKGEGPRVPGQGDDAEFVGGQGDVDDLLSSLGF